MAFFEQLGKRITDAGQSAAQQTKGFADVSRMNRAISEKEKKISQLYLAIGQSYYENHKDSETCEELDKIREINNLFAEIAANRKSINQKKGVLKCEKCGAEVPPTAAFCHVCGAKINHDEKADVPGDGELICPVCHAVVGKENLFCTHCGTKVRNTDE